MIRMKQYEYDTILHEMDDSGGAYVSFPWNVREEFGKGRVKVHALFDGIPYDGSMKTIRNKLNKHDGDMIHVVIEVEE